MKSTISIVSDDMLFPHLFEILLLRKIVSIDINLYTPFQVIDESQIIKSGSLMLIDGGMTQVSSIEVIHQIRAKKRIVEPIWFFTEIDTDSYIRKSQEMGVNKIIRKPFDPYKISDEIAFLFLK